MTKKIKVLTLSDHPLSPSGVGTQTKYMCEALLNTGRYSIVSLGGAIKHQDYTPKAVEPYGEDWKIVPVDGYGTQEMIRSVLRTEKPDILWFMTDPRFWGWLWEMDNEIRANVPMVYYHVWDNYPYPFYNNVWYNSNDVIATISKVTSDIVKTVAPEVQEQYIPHAVDGKVFKTRNSLTDIEKMKEFRKQINAENKFLVTCLSLNDQHELTVLARKHPNLKIFGFWWFMNQPSIIKIVLKMRIDMLGLSFIPQHSDARVTDQLIYKWSHFKNILHEILYEYYEDLLNKNFDLSKFIIERDINNLLNQNAKSFFLK